MGGIVLAGGRSSRMGVDKSTLKVDGHSLLERTVAALASFGPQIVIVGGNVTPPSGVDAVADLYPGLGPVGGIVSGLEALGEGLHVVLACDMPDVNTTLLKYLVCQYREGFDAVIPAVGGRPESLCAVYSYSAVQPLREYMDAGGRSAIRALERLQIIRVEEDELRSLDPRLTSFTNINTPQDLERRRDARP